MKTEKRILIPAVAVCAIAVLLGLLRLFSKDEIPPGKMRPETAGISRDVRTARAQVETVTQWYDAVGTVEPRTKARIEAQVSGQVNEVRVAAGDPVTPGEVLVVLDDRRMQSRLSQARQSLKTASARREQARQAVNSAEAAFVEAESAYNRIKKFFDAEAATEQDLEQAKSRYLQAQAALRRARDGLAGASAGVRMAEDRVREAKIALGYTEIKAPAEGRVLKRLVDPGDLAMPGKPLLLLRTKGGLRLEAYVRESLVSRVQPGARLPVRLTTLQKTVKGEVEELIPYADPRTRTFLVKTKLPDLSGLYPGMYGKLRIPYQEVEAVLVPLAAVQEVGQLALVHVKSDEAGQWDRRYIKTGNVHGDRVEVLAGLSGGETVRLKGSGHVR